MRRLCAPINTALALKKRRKPSHWPKRGRAGTKIDATCDGLGNPTGFHLAQGQEHHLEGFDALLDRLLQADVVLADKAYDADERVRKKLENKGIQTIIPPLKRTGEHPFFTIKTFTNPVI